MRKNTPIGAGSYVVQICLGAAYYGNGGKVIANMLQNSICFP